MPREVAFAWRLTPYRLKAKVPRVGGRAHAVRNLAASQDAGGLSGGEVKVIVSATSNGGISRSSDPHEWRNEMGAVSATYSAKLKYL